MPQEQARPDPNAPAALPTATATGSGVAPAPVGRDVGRGAPAIGPDRARYEAVGKVTGSLRYADDQPVTGALYGYLLTSPIARGRVASIDTTEARALPGVVEIYTHETMADAVVRATFFGSGGYGATAIRPLSGPDIAYEGQITGLVVADDYETARDAAHRVRMVFSEQDPAASFGEPDLRTRRVSDVNPMWEDPHVGDLDRGLAAAAFTVDQEYRTPAQHHVPIELYSTTCIWEGDRLTVYEPSAGVNTLKFGLAENLGIPPDRITVVSPFVGGSFGSKVSVTPRTAIVAAAARRLNRPVKLVLTREQGFTQATHRAETRHHVRMGCDRDGRLTAYGHEGWEMTSRTDAYSVNGTENSVRMYACPNVWTRVNITEADRATPGFMRSPPEVPYIFALECAIDELAEKAGVDPVAFRKLNDTRVDPITGKAYTSRALNECLDAGAAAFGWSRRDPRPGSMRDGDWLIGQGVALAVYPTAFISCSVALAIQPDGSTLVQAAAHDIGTGAYGVAQIVAAQELGLAPEQVRVEMGDSRLPIGPLAGGSNTTASLSNAIAEAVRRLRARVNVPAPRPITDAFAGGAAPGGLEERIDWLPPGAPPNGLEMHRQGKPVFGGGSQGDRLRYAFGAEFVEVRINDRTREIRVPRITGVFAAGRIVNARAARSQYLGGMIWGIGSALHEAIEIDVRQAKYVNDNIAEYLIPVNADIPSVEIIMLPEEDFETNPLGIKGIGELGNVGTNAAIANAVYHATGRRIRDLPINIDKLIG